MAPRRNGRPSRPPPSAAGPLRDVLQEEHRRGLDRNFNSLDNQREAAEAFIGASGTRAGPSFPMSTTTAASPAETLSARRCKRLLADVEAGQIDTIVVYRLDRISRSLADFVKIHEFLEKHGVALVSVTESINTQDAARPDDGQRPAQLRAVRAASWSPSGPGTRSRPLVVGASGPAGCRRWATTSPPRAASSSSTRTRPTSPGRSSSCTRIVRHSSRLPRKRTVAACGGSRGRPRTASTAQARPWDRKTLSNFLHDPLYIGKQKLGDEVVPRRAPRHRAEDAVRQGPATARREPSRSRGQRPEPARRSAAWPAPLLVLRRGDDVRAGEEGRPGLPLLPMPAAGRNGHGTCPTKSVHADQVEPFVVDQIRRIGADPALQDETFRQAVAQVKAQRRGLKLEQTSGCKADLSTPQADVERLVDASRGSPARCRCDRRRARHRPGAGPDAGVAAGRDQGRVDGARRPGHRPRRAGPGARGVRPDLGRAADARAGAGAAAADRADRLRRRDGQARDRVAARWLRRTGRGGRPVSRPARPGRRTPWTSARSRHDGPHRPRQAGFPGWLRMLALAHDRRDDPRRRARDLADAARAIGVTRPG